MNGGSKPPDLRRGVQTTTDNPVDLRPFEVRNPVAPRRWDPQAGALPLSYEIHDPNRRIRSGRILYEVFHDLEWTVIHSHKLTGAGLQHGKHELPESERWDGVIGQGLAGRKGERVTAELSDIRVVIQVWNNSNPSPGAPVSGTEGRTSAAGEWLSRARTAVEIDAIVKAEWGSEFVIQFGHSWEPERGKAEMKIQVKNVREGTPAHITVHRINDIASPSSDFFYVGDRSPGQPGLAGAVVSGGRVLVNGANPFVQFNRYAEHWAYPGNNFYAFSVSFGEFGKEMAASERDYKNHEKACLHMRFTVFIHWAPGKGSMYGDCARALQRFFRSNTKYYRAYLLSRAPSTLEDWSNRFQRHYMVFLLGHAACWCEHPDHPREIRSKKNGRPVDPQPPEPREGEFRWTKDLLHSGFPPDSYVCPDQRFTSKAVTRQIRADERRYHRTFAGCGHGEQVHHQNVLMGDMYVDSRAPAGKLRIFEVGKSAKAMKVKDETGGPIVPRFLLWNGGCRTILTRRLGDIIVSGGTRYYHGWVYSPACDFDQFTVDVMRRWIKGTNKQPAADEFDTERLLDAYNAEAKRGTRPRYHARIMDSSGVLNALPEPEPDKLEDLLK